MYKIKLQGEIDSWGYTRYLLDYDLRNAPEGEEIELEVDSLGGDVQEALSISNMLREHGNITAHIVGFCASAATWLCYGCDRVVINDDCAYLIHKCSAYVDAWGMMNADELDALIEKLKSEKKSNEAIDLIIANKYVKHSRGQLDIKQALKLMKEDRWMLPEEALSLGLVDEVCEEHVLSHSNLGARIHAVNSIKGLPHLPERFVEEQKHEEKKSLASQLKDALAEFFGGSVAKLAPVAPIEPITESNMNEEFQNVNALLSVEAVEERDGSIVLPVDDFRRIEARLEEAGQQAGQLNTLTAERDSARQDLSDAISEIDSISNAIANLDTIAEKAAYIKDLLSKVTGESGARAELEGNGHEYAADPVNTIVAQYSRR